MTTIVPTLWIAGLAAAAGLGAGGWMLKRGRRASPAASPVAVPRARLRDAVEAPTQGGEATTTPAADPVPSVPEAVMLLRLCAPAFAVAPGSDRPLSTSAAAGIESAAADVLGRIDAHPRYTPRRPQVLPQLTRAINDPAASAQSIAAILAQDPALAGNLLRIANSAIYRRHAVPVQHLERAVTLLGSDGLRQIVMAALLQPVIADDGSALARSAARLWEHTLLSAQLAAEAAPDASRDELQALQLLALLYGLGSVVVVQVLRDVCSRRAAGDPDPGLLVSLIEVWSSRCARSISADWGLSTRVQRALDVLACEEGAMQSEPLGQRLSAARALAAERMPGGKGDAASGPQ